MGNAEFNRLREQLEARLNRDPTYRAMKPVDPTWLLGYLLVDPVTGIAPGIDVATPDGTHPMVWLTGWRYIVGRISGEHQGVTYDPSEWVIIRPGHYTGPPIIYGHLVTSPAGAGGGPHRRVRQYSATTALPRPARRTPRAEMASGRY